MNCAAPLDITQLSASTGFTDSGVVTDIHDLGRYAQALAAGALVPEQCRPARRALFPLTTAPRRGSPTSGGVYQAGSLIGQYGSVPGYATAAFADPSSGLTVAVVLNNSGAGRHACAERSRGNWPRSRRRPRAAAGETAPEAGLPWTAQQYHDAITAAAICPIP